MLRRLLLRTSTAAAVCLVLLVASAPLLVWGADAWVAPRDARERTNPVEPTESVLSTGQAMFDRHCKSCHGPEGKGDGPAAKFLTKSPRNLTDASRMKELTDGEIFWKVQEGRPPMPSFETKMNEREIWSVVHYVRTFADASTH